MNHKIFSLVGMIKDIYSNVKGALEGIAKPLSGKQDTSQDVYSSTSGLEDSSQYQSSINNNYGRSDFLPSSSSSSLNQNAQSSGL